MRKVLLLLAFVLPLLQGCATPGAIQVGAPNEPVSTESSLIVGALVNRELNGLVLDGKKYQVTEGDRILGFASFAIEVAPGDHTVDAVGAYSSGAATQYPQKRSFSTGPGEIVNLGSVLVTRLGDGKFVSAWVDNHEDVATDLSAVAPTWLSEALSEGRYESVAGDYADLELLNAILVNEFSFGAGLATNAPANLPRYYEGSLLGAIIEYVDTAERAQPVNVIRTDITTDYFENCDGEEARVICVVQNTTLLDDSGLPPGNQTVRFLAFVDPRSGDVSNKPLPFDNERSRAVVAFGNEGVALVSGDFTVYLSADEGETWSSVETGVEPSFMQMDNGVKYKESGGKLTLFLEGSSSATVQVDVESGQLAIK